MSEEEEKEVKKRGGTRKGAGRKRLLQDDVTVSFNVKLPKKLMELIEDNYPNRSAFVRDAIREKLIRGRII